MCLLNLHEDERSKPSAWIPVGWIPVYNETRDLRPGSGYDSSSARKVRLFHQCWIEFLDKWEEKTKESQLVPWADGVSRMTRFFVGWFLGGQQEGDKYTGEPCACHRCQAPRDSYLSTDYFSSKTMKFTRNKVQLAAEGAFFKINNQKAKWIVRWDPDGRNVRAGPGIAIISIIYYYFYCFIYLHLSAKIAKALNPMKLKGRKQDVISFSMLFG